VLATHTRRIALAGVTSTPLPLDDPDALLRALEHLAPEVIVHTAGLTSVEACERDPALARHANADLARNVARAAARLGLRLIHISTDHLFAGDRAFYKETDTPEPLNVYAQTKLLAEQWVRQEHAEALLVRTNFFGWGHRLRQSFSDWIYDNLHAGTAFPGFEDVFITPIIADRLAVTAHRLLAMGSSGVYNIVGEQRLSKYEFGVQLADAFNLPRSLIIRAKITQSKLSAQRPPDMSLDSAKTRERLGGALGSVAEYLHLLQSQERTGRRGELLAAVTE